MARLWSSHPVRRLSLHEGWELARCAPDTVLEPKQLDSAALEWLPAEVPGTLGSALRAARRWSLDQPSDFDTRDVWFRVRFAAPPLAAQQAVTLTLAGLATVAEVWLNDVHLLSSDNMFHEHVVDVSRQLQASNTLAVRCRAIAPLLAARRPRPRWKTRLVSPQQLRYVRTSLLGHIPGWTPRCVAVGPWRPVTLEWHETCVVTEASLQPQLHDKHGSVQLRMRVRSLDGVAPRQPQLRVGHASAPLTVSADADGFVLEGLAHVDDVQRWWPHTHGAQPLYPVSITWSGDRGPVELSAAKLGFRTVEVDTSQSAFSVRVNGEPIFCRGAHWTTTDVVTLTGDDAAYAAALDQVRAAGMNMLRVGGTHFYEADAFYEGCDARGILVWQDYMFANMDYPAEDSAFLASVRREAQCFLSRVQTSPALAVVCGNSEVEQQAAMLGLPRALWKGPLFEEVLPAETRAARPDVCYWPSSPSGGSMPFHANAGVTHYYGVGAYLRPPEDARRAGVRFTSECLAFANVPQASTIEAFMADGEAPVHHPRWKARVPRDHGSGWDFEDVRDHYLAQLFGVDALRTRYADMPRYLALSRVTTGELIASTLSEWRRPGSSCHGALVFFYRDLWPGAGWGIVDALGQPKAAYFYAKRVLSPRAVLASDEGLNGTELYVLNDTPVALRAQLQLTLYQHGEVQIAQGRCPVEVPARGHLTVNASTLFDHFVDFSYAYRFGPPSHDVAVAALLDASSGERMAETFLFPLGLSALRRGDPGLEASAQLEANGDAWLTLRAARFAQSVAIDVRDATPEDAFFHLEPGVTRRILLRRGPEARPLSGWLWPLNADAPTRLAVVPQLEERS
jgi:beta-mannosidase